MRGNLDVSQFDRYTSDLLYAITILACAKMWEKHPNTVVRAIDTGALFAAKLDEDIGTKGGIWLISYTSAVDLWGQPVNHEEIAYNHVEPR